MPDYIVKERSDGSQAVFDMRKPREGCLGPRYVVRDGKIYKADEPALPVREFRRGKEGGS